MTNAVLHWVQSGGYFAVFLAMVLESACVPLPSEVIMPFAGYLAFAGHLQLWMVIIMGILGNIVGSLVAYYIGKFVGRAVIMRYGRYVGVTERHLRAAETWFAKRGEWAVFVGRLLPGIRTFISLPAGAGSMPIVKFTLFTLFGSLPWVAVLADIGYQFGQNWQVAKTYVHPLMYVAVAIVVVLVVFAAYKLWKRRKTKEASRAL